MSQLDFPHDLAADLVGLDVELRPPLGPEGWPEIRYPGTDRLQLGISVNPRERRVNLAASWRPWTAGQADDIARILTSCTSWLRQTQTETDDPDTS